MDLAAAVRHPWAMTMAQGYAALIHVLCRDLLAALERAEATVQLATDYGVDSWVGRGMMLRGWALTEQGRATEGLGEMQQGLADWHARGEELGKPFWLALLGEGYANAGRVDEGLQVIAEALAMAQRRELRFRESELHRLQGELLLRRATGAAASATALHTSAAASASHPYVEAEACFRRALAHAQRWHAKSLELRAAMSLSRLWLRQGKQRAAGRMLEEHYRWFAEGLGTADLRDASILLQQLSD
jgi:predicted ATPase